MKKCEKIQTLLYSNEEKQRSGNSLYEKICNRLNSSSKKFMKQIHKIRKKEESNF